MSWFLHIHDALRLRVLTWMCVQVTQNVPCYYFFLTQSKVFLKRHLSRTSHIILWFDLYSSSFAAQSRHHIPFLKYSNHLRIFKTGNFLILWLIKQLIEIVSFRMQIIELLKHLFQRYQELLDWLPWIIGVHVLTWMWSSAGERAFIHQSAFHYFYSQQVFLRTSSLWFIFCYELSSHGSHWQEYILRMFWLLSYLCPDSFRLWSEHSV